jgi:hypothetical protein
MMKRMVVTLALAACCITGANAQTGAVKATPGTMIAPSKTFDGLLNIFQDELMGLVKAMPAEKYNFAPAQAIFKAEQGTNFDTVRTFAQQAAHLAQANYYFFGTAAGIKPDVDTKAIEALTDKDKIVAALDASFVFAHKAIATLTPQNSFDAVKAFPDSTRASMTAFGIAHGYDHYGQMCEYMRMNGMIPPASQKK